MKIAIGSDHRGFELKEMLIEYLRKKKHIVKDYGAFSQESCDYPKFAFKVAKAVFKKKFDYGILICYSGIGMAMAANKIKGIRAANCYNLPTTRFSREHNNANVLVLGAGFVNEQVAKRIVNLWLKTAFVGGRHQRRIKMFK